MFRRPVKFGSGCHMSQSSPGHQNATSLTTHNKYLTSPGWEKTCTWVGNFFQLCDGLKICLVPSPRSPRPTRKCYNVSAFWFSKKGFLHFHLCLGLRSDGFSSLFRFQIVHTFLVSLRYATSPHLSPSCPNIRFTSQPFTGIVLYLRRVTMIVLTVGKFLVK
jgi:hypothetical protein